MTKDEFVQKTRDGYARWEAALAGMDDAHLVLPGFAGDWSAKDVIAHIAWYEREIAGVIRSRTLAGSELWDRPLQERNDAIYQADRNRPLDEVRREAAEVHAGLIGALQTLSDEDLVDASHFADMPADWQPWEVFASDTFEHYKDHLPAG